MLFIKNLINSFIIEINNFVCNVNKLENKIMDIHQIANESHGSLLIK